MTTDEYASEIGAKLRDAYNSKDAKRVSEIFREAQDELNSSSISEGGRKGFWSAVEAEFFGGRLLVEKQEASELYRLMREIEAQLAAKQGKDR